MSNVASLELCKELYELSGWECNGFIYVQHDDEYDIEYYGKDMPKDGGVYPAYDLGYLLRKLPMKVTKGNLTGYLQLEPMEDDEWQTSYVFHYQEDMEVIYGAIADTPEDAAAKLAIELFKQGVLTKTQT